MIAYVYDVQTMNCMIDTSPSATESAKVACKMLQACEKPNINCFCLKGVYIYKDGIVQRLGSSEKPHIGRGTQGKANDKCEGRMAEP